MNQLFENKIVTEIVPKKLGLIEKRLRVSSHLTIEQTANYLNISKGNLSEIEKGRRGLKGKVFARFIERFYPDFDWNLSIVKEAEKKLEELVVAFIYRNSVQERHVEEWANQNRKRLLNSLACLHLTVFETYFYYGKSIDRDEEELLNSSEDFIQYFPPDTRALLLFNKGYRYMCIGNSSQAAELFEAALREMDGKNWPQLEGIIKLNLAGVIARDVSFRQAIDLVDQAQECFEKGAIFLRILSCYNNKASYLCCIGQYEMAVSIVDKVILNKDTFRDSQSCTLAVSNKILMEALWGRFEEALTFIRNHKSELNPRHPDNFILEPYCLLRTGEKRTCLSVMKQYQTYSLGEDDEAFYKLIKAVISMNTDRVEKAKRKMFQICRKTKNWGMLLIMVQALAYFYKQTNQNDRLVEVYEWQAMLHNHQLPDLCEM